MRASQEEINVAIADEIIALEASMQARQRLMDLTIQAGEMTEKLYKSMNDAYHRQRIELLILKGEIPKPVPKKPRFRNGLYL